MFTRAFASVLSLAILAVAIPNGQGHPQTTITITAHGSQPTHVKGGTCSTGPVQCCNRLQKDRLPLRNRFLLHSLLTLMRTQATDPSVVKELGATGVVLSGTDVLVGTECTPINVIGVFSGNSCKANTVCCQNNSLYPSGPPSSHNLPSVELVEPSAYFQSFLLLNSCC
ncbi:hydrophobin-domain-containing protein, partial [Lentinus tigrinus ALCF2SS1-6]